MWSLTGKPSSPEPRERLVVRSQPRATLLHAELVGEEREVARRRDRVSFCRRLPAAALRGFANSRSPASPWRRFSSSNDASGMNTSPRTSSRAGRFEPESSCGMRPIVSDVRGDVFAGLAVATRRGADEAAVLVEQRDREAVELGLADEAHGIGHHPLDPCAPGEQLVAVERVVERQHAHDVADRREAWTTRTPPDLGERGTLAELRVLRFAAS